MVSFFFLSLCPQFKKDEYGTFKKLKSKKDEWTKNTSIPISMYYVACKATQAILFLPRYFCLFKHLSRKP